MAKKRKGPTPRRDSRSAPRSAAGASRSARPASAASRHKPPAYQEQMFFPRLRNHAKWAFVGLALVFIVGFVVYGVGSGNGVGNLFGNGGLLSGAGSSGPSISALEKSTKRDPQDAAAWKKLALAYQGQQEDARAIAALKRYLSLRPKDTASLANLAALYQSQASTAQQKLTDLYQQAPSGLSATPFSSTALSNALGADPLESAVQAELQQQATPLQSQYQKGLAGSLATYKKVVKAAPGDPQSQLELGVAADSQGDYQTAVTAYQAFLRLAPDDPNVAQVKQRVSADKKLLKPSKASK